MEYQSGIQVGQTFENFTYETAWEQGKKLYNQLGSGKTLLVFSRYIGCHPCQMELVDLAGRYPKIVEKGGNLLVVMQSEPEVVRDTLEPGIPYTDDDGNARVFGKAEMPYDLICDPPMALYKQYGIPVAENEKKLGSLEAMAKLKRAERMGFQHGKYEGEELQYPATFLLDANGTVTFAHYGKSFADYLSEAQIMELLG